MVIAQTAAAILTAGDRHSLLLLGNGDPDRRRARGGLLRLPLKDLKTMGGDCLVALLQVENAGPILGAAEYELAADGT